MAYIRRKKVKGNTYYYVVEYSKDEKGKRKQKIVAYLGNVDNILSKFGVEKDKN